MTNSLIPESHATNAYELLDEVCILILQEPLRYNQGRFILTSRDRYSGYCRFPACNTIGCVAGWVVTLKGPKWFEYEEVARLAQGLLGLDNWQRDEFFDANAAGMTEPQTLAHAEAGVAHIRAFQAEYEDQLKAKQL